MRRVVVPQVRFVSLPADFLPLFLLLGVAVSGIVMRYGFRIDVVDVKGSPWAWSRCPVAPEGIAPTSCSCTCSW